MRRIGADARRAAATLATVAVTATATATAGTTTFGLSLGTLDGRDDFVGVFVSHDQNSSPP